MAVLACACRTPIQSNQFSRRFREVQMGVAPRIARAWPTLRLARRGRGLLLSLHAPCLAHLLDVLEPGLRLHNVLPDRVQSRLPREHTPQRPTTHTGSATKGRSTIARTVLTHLTHAQEGGGSDMHLTHPVCVSQQHAALARLAAALADLARQRGVAPWRQVVRLTQPVHDAVIIKPSSVWCAYHATPPL